MDLSPDDEDFTGRLLHQAALWDNVELLQELIIAGADVNARDSSNRTALHGAALCERSRCLVALCDARCLVDVVCCTAAGSKTALHLAAERGHTENIQVLLAHGANLELQDAGGSTALTLAERAGHRHAATVLRSARDTLEKERLTRHAELRELVTKGDVQGVKALLMTLGPDAGLVVNLSPGGANTLLYLASEAGNTQMLLALLSAGADGRAHPVTAYCPLYIACYRGHKGAVRLLLQYYPEAVQQETVEKWLPLHAACIGGHAEIVTLLLEYNYPEELLQTYTDEKTGLLYRAAMDINLLDASGQTPLYVAATLANEQVASALCRFTLPSVPDEKEPKPPPPNAAVLSPHRSGISLGIHAIVSKLTGHYNAKAQDPPLVRCASLTQGPPGDCPLGAATRSQHYALTATLLKYGAPADSSCWAPKEVRTAVAERLVSPPRARARSASAPPRAPPAAPAAPSPSPQRDAAGDAEGPWTPLAVAAYYKNTELIELLIANGATDSHSRALKLCVNNQLRDLVPAILATKACPDTEYKINRSLICSYVFGSRNDSLTYKSLCPTSPVAVSWRALRVDLQSIRMKWLYQAAHRLNPLVQSPNALASALTRIELADNELRTVPAELFALPSVRYLNIAQNKLERLPAADASLENDSEPRSKKRDIKIGSAVYTAPVLQDLYLQDNRLEELPPALFTLPSLQTLDVSNNKLRLLPGALWSAPKLKDFNAALNHLKSLPGCDEPSKFLTASNQTSPVTATSEPLLQRHGVNFNFGPFSRSTSRSSSLDQNAGETIEPEGEEGVVYFKSRSGNAIRSEIKQLHEWQGVTEAVDSPKNSNSCLTSLNLSHNQFTSIPPPLACRATELQRLNMAYNSLRSMSYVTSYPASLRQLDLSHNEITCWPSLPQVETLSSSEPDPHLQCFCGTTPPPRRPRSGESMRSQVLHSVCPRRRHLRLDSLRTLILSNNLLTRIQLTTDDDGYASELEKYDVIDEECEWGSTKSNLRGRILFPLLSMLDVSCNLLRSIPQHIHALSNLAVFNISGNKDITDLPAQMGLLSRLWNLSASGCNLQGPVATMLSQPRCRSMDVVGYLKSLLHQANKYSTLKLMLVGRQGIGKTSLLECLRQESGVSNRRKGPDHWSRRMGNPGSVGNISTVGVDIGSWTYSKGRGSRPPLVARTWDFAGQQEYYATHQYFLSKRSLYLVVWKASDGRKGLAGALEWLRSIQSRAPGSPVIMVATHYDQVANSNLPASESPEALQRIISTRIMAAPDADKLGLPRVMDTVEVSCSTKHNIRLLADIIYTVAYSIKAPGSKEPLLEQRVPASYLALEECVYHLAHELKEPVLNREQFKRMVTQYMQQKNYKMFRDSAEFNQATTFLHENGVLLHYSDANLKDLYFLNPQWLSDLLAHVLTVKEINPFVVNGIMHIDELPLVLKSSPGLQRDPSELVALLNKFELALPLDGRCLLLPPLLPVNPPATPQVLAKNKNWLGRGCGAALLKRGGPIMSSNMERTDSPTLIQEPSQIVVSGRAHPAPLRRLTLLSYSPVGLCARLAARLLECGACRGEQPYSTHLQLDGDEAVSKALDMQWSWKLWQTGISLVSDDITLVTIRELPSSDEQLLGPSDTPIDHPYYNYKFRIVGSVESGGWCETSVCESRCVEVCVPATVLVLRRSGGAFSNGCQSISIEPSLEVLAKILAIVTDHIDLLLEDWYPSLGTRFVHTSEGKCLITRLIPCPACLRDPVPVLNQPNQQMQEAMRRLELHDEGEVNRARGSVESRCSDGDSGVGQESNGSSRVGSAVGPGQSSERLLVHSWTVEHCVRGKTDCPTHGPQYHLAPDLELLDIEESLLAKWEDVQVGKVLGRGAFAEVRQVTWRGEMLAAKLLEPPPQGDKIACGRFSRGGPALVWRAYAHMRTEARALRSLTHAHAGTLRAVCARPLALLLPLAPQGSLDAIIRALRNECVRFGARVLRLILLQIARALEYIHAKRIVYRDLKSENVLVWSMPRPQDMLAAEQSPSPIDVHVKLGDYGISRLSLPSGTKGFGGTEGFMAPEIMQYNGEEEYNEKVDCFSYGMVIYELVRLKQPFEGHEAVKEAILEGARPALTPRELVVPLCVLETMRRCWMVRSDIRPAAAALVSITAAAEFSTLQCGAAVRHAECACAVPLYMPDEEEGGWEIWCGNQDRLSAIFVTSTRFVSQHSTVLPPATESGVTVTALQTVGTQVWVGDTAGRLLVYNGGDMSLCWTVRITESVGGSASPVSALAALPTLQRVAVALLCGRLFIVSASQPEEEGSFVLTELGTATHLCALAAQPTPDGYVLASGGDGGISLYNVTVSGVTRAVPVSVSPVTRLAVTPTRLAAYQRPGSIVHSWCLSTLAPGGSLDCSKLAPCSESLHSCTFDESIPEESSQVTSLCVCENTLYVCTAWGCLIVADAESLRPITVCRPADGPIPVIVPLYPHKHTAWWPMIATFGKGYRPLVDRFVSQNTSNTENTSNDNYCLMWRAGRWLPD